MWKNKDICVPKVKNELKHWTGPTMVDVCLCLLYVMLVCLSLSFFCIVVSSLNVFTADCFLLFGVMRKSVGSICFWPISVECAVRLARFVSSGVFAYQNLEVFRDRFGKRGEERSWYAVWFSSGRISKFSAFFLPVFLPLFSKLRTIV